MPNIPNENSAEYKKQLSSHKKNISAAAVKKEENEYGDKKKCEKCEKSPCKCEKKEAYATSENEGAEPIVEKAPPGAKFERMVKHIKKGYSKDGLSDKEKSIAYATAWKAKNKAK